MTKYRIGTTNQKRCPTSILVWRTSSGFRNVCFTTRTISHKNRYKDPTNFDLPPNTHSRRHHSNTLGAAQCKSEIQLESECGVGSRRRPTSSDGDLNLEVVSINDGVVVRELASLHVGDTVRGQLCLPLLLTVLVAVRVVLRGDDNASLVVLEVGDDISPTFVVVDAKSDDEVLVGVGNEAKGATSSTTTHSENMRSVDAAPRSTVGVVPDRLLDKVEECFVIGLVDLDSDGVTHSGGKC